MSVGSAPRAPRAALLSLEPWDDVWRRNQHLASNILHSGRLASVVFVEPPRGGLAPRPATRREGAVEVVTSPLLVPRRLGGHRLITRSLARLLAGIDLLWINDPVIGAGLLEAMPRPAVYDVTDDWRSMPQAQRDRIRVVAAEDRLARSASRTVVCSPVLEQRWRERYAVNASVIPNGFDAEAIRGALHRPLAGPAPHLVYVGTVHENRVDLELIRAVAAATAGTVHLVGPHPIDADALDRLTTAGVDIVGAVPSTEVPGWLVSADLLLCPHHVSDFTLSLDAIKSYEYLATDRPVVATPTSGFQFVDAPGVAVVGRADFVAAVQRSLGTGPYARAAMVDWVARADQFADVLDLAMAGRRPR